MEKNGKVTITGDKAKIVFSKKNEHSSSTQAPEVAAFYKEELGDMISQLGSEGGADFVKIKDRWYFVTDTNDTHKLDKGYKLTVEFMQALRTGIKNCPDAKTLTGALAKPSAALITKG
jgi:hypothetical protein